MPKALLMYHSFFYLGGAKLKLLKNISDDYERAYELVNYLFKGVLDKEGEPYINHLKRVSDRVTNKNTKVAGLLHDVVEDTNITFEALKELKFNDEIIELVKIVTKDKNKKQIYHDRITEIINTNNIEAIKLKYADMCDNADPERLKLLTEEKRNYFINKYQKEMERLEEILKERGENL